MKKNKTIRDILDKIDHIVGEREGVSLDLGYLKDEDYSLDQALKEISELLLECKPDTDDPNDYDTPLERFFVKGHTKGVDDYEKNIKDLL